MQADRSGTLARDAGFLRLSPEGFTCVCSHQAIPLMRDAPGVDGDADNSVDPFRQSTSQARKRTHLIDQLRLDGAFPCPSATLCPCRLSAWKRNRELQVRIEAFTLTETSFVIRGNACSFNEGIFS